MRSARVCRRPLAGGRFCECGRPPAASTRSIDAVITDWTGPVLCAGDVVGFAGAVCRESVHAE